MEEALAKAKAIAAKLALGVTGTTPTGELGKRKSRWDEDHSAIMGAGLGAMKKKKVYIPVNQHPDVNFLGLLIGPRGKTQKEMQERTGAKILVRGKGSQKEGMSSGHPDDDDELHVSIEGPHDSVEKALAEVEEILFNPEQALRLKNEQLKNLAELSGPGGMINTPQSTGMRDHYGNPMTLDENSLEVKVPNNLVGLIIGKGGEHIQKLQAQTGAHVQIAKESDMLPGDTHRSIMLRGETDAVAEAKRRIDDVINERMQPMQSKQSTVQQNTKKELDNYSFILRIPVPNDKVGVVIGRGGITIKMIQEKTRAHVQVPTGPDEDNQEVRTLSVGADSREAAEAAQMEIFMVLQQQQMQANAPAANSVLLQVPDDKVGVIIGRQGSTIKDIQSRTQCRIQIPPHADPGTNPPIRTVSIQGAPEQQFMAKFEIETLLGLMPGMDNRSYGGSMPSMQWGASSYAPQAPMYMTGYGQQSAPSHTDSYYGYNQTTAVTPPVETPPTDPTAYYADFWQYAAYYGEAAARAYYTTWSPPEGTPPPEGVVVPPPPPPMDSTEGTATTEGTTEQSVEQNAEEIAAAWENYHKQMAEQSGAVSQSAEEVVQEAVTDDMNGQVSQSDE